ncbi:MAG: hypothetical protein JSU04_08800 [Bdellovibrionales bacterium]|nr:hypothetical protein [Bdellovibrionales bacterium]
MNTYDISKMTKGWFIGDFQPNVFHSKDFEVAVKYYKAGDKEGKHLHKISTEYTMIASGRVKMNSITYAAGAIIEIQPNEATDFEALEDTITVVVKVPSSQNDKYLVEN